MIKLNQFDSSRVNISEYCNEVQNMLESNPAIMGGIFSPVIEETENILSTFFDKKVVMTSSGTASLLISIEYAQQLSSKPQRFYVSEFLYFSLVSFFLNKEVIVIKSNLNEVSLDYPELDGNYFNIFILTSHHNTLVNTDYIVNNLPSSSRFIIEDRCLVFDSRKSNSDVSCYSFANNKLLNCGEGGCISSENKSFIEWAKYRTYSGIVPNTTNKNFMYLGKYTVKENTAPFKCSINALSCLLIQKQMSILSNLVQVRTKNFNSLKKNLKFHDFEFDHPLYPLFYDLILPHPFSIKELNYLQMSLLKLNIQSHVGVLPFTFYKTNQMKKSIISLPIHGLLHDEEISYISKNVKKLINEIQKRSNK